MQTLTNAQHAYIKALEDYILATVPADEARRVFAEAARIAYGANISAVATSDDQNATDERRKP